MARPKDWQPLRESDPVPGDPVAVREQVKHMKKIAEYLRTQAEALNAMADADNLKGKYAEKLGEDSRALGRKLDEAEDRYREVKGHLSGWAEDLEGFQKRADKALDDAKEAKRVIDAHENKPDSDKKDKDGDDKDKKGDKGSDTEDPALKKAKEDLEDARGRLNSAAGDYDERASHYAGKIRKSIDDDMKDSWWNDFKAWVADADWIGDWADKLSWLATVVGIAAMFFPALGVIALALTIVVAAAHLLMAATGNGSWFDVVMDIGALKMARNGVKAAKAIKALQQSSRKTAAGVAKEGAQSSAAATRKNAMKNAAKGEKKGGGRSGGDRQRNRARRLKMEQKNRTAGKKAGDEVRDAEMPQITAQEKASMLGDAQLGKQMKDINKWRDTYPDNTKLADNAREAARQKDALRGSWAVGTGLDAADKGGDAVSDGEYGRMKDRMTTPLPGTSRW
ncbi:putative T7SS-secreted protein [Streptomyces sp. NPDC018029]|uniref:putative T7SS-secreted protein n=1 Tax=Streptomyces sp. NPDC018029 TaxID=3365032 RepID=UPI00379CDB5C